MDKDRIEKNPKLYAPLVLAYIGDAEYEIYVRTRLIKIHPDMPVHKLHKAAIHYVKAQAQSMSILAIYDELTEEEQEIFKRGRNAKSPTIPKNADVSDYRRATGFEALMGFLYLDKQESRLLELMEKSFNYIENYKESLKNG